jgi:hypothetical protein
MAYTQADIDALREKIALGASRAKYHDKDIEFRPLAEMQALLAQMEGELAGKKKVRRRYAYYSDGIHE